MSSQPGIFCLEGQWTDDLRDEGTVQPLLDTLRRLKIAEAIYRDVATRAELDYYVSKWRLKRYADYNIGYFAFHGSPGALHIGTTEVITLEELGELLAGRCEGRLIHFGACATLRVSEERLSRFKRATGAWAVSGFIRNVDWLRSAAFELGLLAEANAVSRPATLVRRLGHLQGGLIAELGWRCV